MKLSKKIAILATALISFAFISCDTDTDDSKPPAESSGSTGTGGSTGSGGSGETGGSTGSGGESEGNPVLPGIKGGTGNVKDTFAGKIFYDSVEKDTAESYTKYVFSTDGTVEIYNKMMSQTEHLQMLL